MTIASELTTLNSTKQAIKAAIQGKGQDLTGVNFAGYADKIAAISSGSGGESVSSEWSQAYYDAVAANTAWVRPVEWLTIPDVTPTDEIFYGLRGVYDTDNEVVAFTVSGAYTVDWGDGTSPVNYAAGTTASYKYTYSAITNPVLSDGSKQVLVTITPQPGQQLTAINLQVRHPTMAAQYESNWLDIVCSTPNMTTNRLNISASTQLVYTKAIQRVVWYNTGYTGTDLSYMFSFLSNLASVSISNTAAVTNMGNMFYSCSSLQTIPLLNTAAVTNMGNMFQSCSSLQTIPLLDTAKVTNMSYMFSYCYSLQTIPLLNTAAVTNMGNMFYSCYSLQTIPLLNTAAVTNMGNMFYSCYSLQTIPLLNTAAVTNMGNMFYSCSSLQTIPLLDTAKVTNMSYMFSYCYSLQTIPSLVTSAVTSSSNFNFTFTGCQSLSRIRASAFKYTFSVASCALTAAALNEIFTNLPTVTGQTITITGNPGASDAATDRSIATAKGWTVTG